MADEYKKIYYTLVLPSGQEEGRYSTSAKGKPRDAAKKAANQYFKNNNSNRSINLTIRRLGSNKVFSYVASRKQLQEPIRRTLPDGSSYLIRHKIDITREYTGKTTA